MIDSDAQTIPGALDIIAADLAVAEAADAWERAVERNVDEFTDASHGRLVCARLALQVAILARRDLLLRVSEAGGVAP